MDLIVESKQFREDLVKNEYNYIKKLCEPKLVSKDWEKLFVSVLEKNEKLDRKLSIIDRLENFIFLSMEKLYIKKFREKNIRVWGKQEYERLTKN